MEVRRADVDPVYVMPAEELYDIVYYTFGLDSITCGVDRADDIEHCRKNHTDSDRVGYIGQEEYCL